MTDKTYEQVAAQNWPKERLPVDDGTRCPPFRAALFWLAEAISNDAPLTPELEELKDHLNECGACDSTVSSVVSLLAAKSKESPNEVLNHVTWEGTPLRRLRDCARSKVYLPNERLADVFRAICFAANMSEDDAFDAVGWPEEGRIWLDECGEDAICLMSDLGVEKTVIELSIESQFRNGDLGVNEDFLKRVNGWLKTQETTKSKMHPISIAARPVGPPSEQE